MYTIKTIPHRNQRYNTVGDYLTDQDGNTSIMISELGNQAMESLIALHELVEIMLCQQAGITEKAIDEFDFEFSKNRAAGDASEPGDDPSAPYFAEHQFATKVEKEMCQKLGIGWDEYEKRIAEVMATYPA
jgi:hypothetical protein